MSKNCFIYETLNDVKSMDIKKTSDGMMHLSGVFGVCGIVNNNKRTYVKENYAKMVETLKKRIVDEGCPGELEHPNSMNITLENVSHKIDKIDISEDGVVTGEITLLNTPKGKIAQALVEGGLPLFISSRAQGNVDKNGIVTLEELKTYDLVGSPGFSQARLKLNENQIVESLNESVYYVTDKDEPAPIEEANKVPENTPEINKEKNNNINDMTNEELQNRVEELEKTITEMKAQIDSKPTIKQVSEAVEAWVNGEIKDKLEAKISEVADSNKPMDVKAIAEAVQNWILKEYTPEIQNWLVEQFAPEVQNWIVEQFAPEVQNWLIEQYSPEVQNWSVEQLAPSIEGWFNEHMKPEFEKMIKESAKPSLANIDETLSLLEGLNTPKPKFSNRQINENNTEPRYIREMPADIRVKYDMASKELKESIATRAKLYSFVNEASIENFWRNISFEETKKPVNESANAYTSDWEARIRKQLRKN